MIFLKCKSSDIFLQIGPTDWNAYSFTLTIWWIYEKKVGSLSKNHVFLSKAKTLNIDNINCSTS